LADACWEGWEGEDGGVRLRRMEGDLSAAAAAAAYPAASFLSAR